MDASCLEHDTALDGTTAAERALVSRVLDAVPAAGYEMNALLSLLRIEVTRDVATASVSCARRPVLRINPEFVAERCRTDEHLFMLVMHELYHVLLGHTRLFVRSTPLANLAFDAVINALLCLRFPAPAYASFFLGLYGTASGSARLLAPPSPVVIGDPVLDELHGMLYGKADVTALEVFEAIERRGQPADVLLLGTHGDDEDGWGTDGVADRDMVAVIRRIVERWPPPPDTRIGRSLSDELRRSRVTPLEPHAAVRAAVRRALCAAATRPGGPRVRCATEAQAQVAIPTLHDRAAQVARALLRTPLLYRAPVAVPRGQAGRRAAVYLDVSGSMAPYLVPLYGALRALRAHVAPEVHLFSTVIETVPLAALCGGVVRTTGGTDSSCVLEHALGSDADRVLVVTDGYVGRPNAALHARFAARGPELRVLLTPGGWRSDLEPLASRIDVLPTL
jgi:hypothetical protein